METFWTLLGVLVAVMFFRGIYDYLKSKSAQQEEKLRYQHKSVLKKEVWVAPWKIRKESDKALMRIYGSHNKVRSIRILSKKFHCYPSEVEACFRVNLFSRHYSKEQQEELINKMRESKPKEADILKIDPNDTPSAFLEKWHIEFYQKFK